MKSLWFSAIVLALVRTPVGAALVTIEEPNQNVQCDSVAARMIVNGSKDDMTEQEVNPCPNDSEGEANTDEIRLTPANAATSSESSEERIILAVH